ncbi:TraM recognition domain-containing protein [Intrasporangium sp.]|uniref:type IV secretory system conjugative DNA transfer family protein n=1 Tax=Intrasporangium sp. TaxID=1925024 RepID=UPI0032218EC2
MLFAGVVLGAGGVCGLTWLAACAAAFLTGGKPPPFSLAAVLRLLTDPLHPNVAWGTSIGPTCLFWVVFVVLLAAAAAGALLFRRSAGSSTAHQAVDRPGVAGRSDVRRAAGARRVLRRGRQLRPSLDKATIGDLGFRLGASRGVACYATVEDSTLVLGPPRSGKGLHLVIPAILDAPGPVVTTSTRPDNLTTTLATRQGKGPVAVFDPQHLAPGVPSAARWSPIRGCQDPHVAMVRAKALTAGAAHGTTDATFWQASAEQAVRALLHAAALGGASPLDLYRWSMSAVTASEAVDVLTGHPGAAPGWQHTLQALTGADPRQRDAVWAMVGIAFSALADPKVLDAVSPDPGEDLDPHEFLTGGGTIYLLGTSTGASATAGLVGAFLEDILETARTLAAARSGARLDPPLSLVLDEAANYPLPSLPSLMSDGGGSGITATVVLQSLAQARAVWGEHAAAAIWDAAIDKVILGGGSSTRDLDELSRLIGTTREPVHTSTIGEHGHHTTSTSTIETPILDPAALRTLPFGTGVLLLREAPPIALTLRPWTARNNAATLQQARTDTEETIRRAHTG